MSVLLLPLQEGESSLLNSRRSRAQPGTSVETVTFRGSDHSSQILKGLCELWKDNQLTDVTLKVGNRTFPCHRNVLASTSVYFHRMFCSDMQESKSQVVSMQGIAPESLSTILDFAYTSRITLTKENATCVLAAADMLLMPLLKGGCVSFLGANLDASNCLSVYALAERHNCDELANKAWSFALRNFRQVRKHREILEQSFEHLEKYLSTDDLVIEEEEEVFETIIAWTNVDHKERLDHLKKLMSHLREHLLPTQYLVDKVLSHTLLTKSQSLSMTIEASSRHRGDLISLHRERSRSRHVMLIVGGIGPANIKLTEVKYYDPVDHRWSTFSHLPFDSEPVSCVSTVDDDVYVMGARGSFIVHRSKISEWCNLSSLPLDRVRQRLSCTSSDGDLYFVGGFDGMQRVALVDRFSTQDLMWHEIAPLPVAVSSPAVAVFRNQLIVFGGALANGTASDFVYSYNLGCSSHRWESRSQMPHPFSGITAVVLGPHVYIVGSVAAVVHRYDPANDTWDQVGNLGNTHALCGATVCSGKIYVTGGENHPNSPISSVERYDVNTKRWNPCENLPYPMRLHGCVSVIKKV